MEFSESGYSGSSSISVAFFALKFFPISDTLLFPFLRLFGKVLAYIPSSFVGGGLLFKKMRMKI